MSFTDAPSVFLLPQTVRFCVIKPRSLPSLPHVTQILNGPIPSTLTNDRARLPSLCIWTGCLLSPDMPCRLLDDLRSDSWGHRQRMREIRGIWCAWVREPPEDQNLCGMFSDLPVL